MSKSIQFFLLFLLLIVYGCSTPQTVKETPANTIKISVVNFKITGDQKLENQLSRINDFAAKAKKLGSNYFLLPELMVLDLLPVNPEDSIIPIELEKLSAEFSLYENGLSKIAQDHSLYIIGASAVTKQNGKFINRGFFINPQGKVLYQDKVYPTPWETRHNFVGGKKIELFQPEDMSFVVLICHDAEFPILSNAIALLKPEVIFVPSQTDDLHGLERVKLTSAARAVEHQSYVLMTGTSGDKNAQWHSYVGKNFLFTPQNKYFLNKNSSGGGVYSEELSLFEIDLETLRKARSDSKQVYPARDQALP